MTTLLFNHHRWTVATEAWSVAGVNDDNITIYYTWAGAGGSYLGAGIAETKLPISMAEFVTAICEPIAQSTNVCDLRTFQRERGQ